MTVSPTKAVPTQKQAMSCAMSHVLGNTCRLAMTTLNYHWNVRGPQFYPMHKLFEHQYREMWEALDPIAERIRALGSFAIADHTDNVVVPVVAAPEDMPDADGMMANLVAGHESMQVALRSALDIAHDQEDEATVTLLGERAVAHGTHAWMIRSSIA